MQLFFVLCAQLVLISSAFAVERGGMPRGRGPDEEQRYMQEKEQFRRVDEGGGAYVPGWGGGAYVAPENADPAYDSQEDQDMLFDSYHK